MFFLIFIIAAILAFYLGVYRRCDYNGKIVCKAVMIYLGLGITAIFFMVTVSFVAQAVEDEQDKQLPSRLESVEYSARRNDYGWMADFMEGDQDYEEEFECYWERIIMHEVTLRYRIYVAADEAGLGEEFSEEADKYEQLMKKYCVSPVYTQNIPYGEYFMELAGYNEEE